jgi:superfamily II DNA or RNA helicase
MLATQIKRRAMLAKAKVKKNKSEKEKEEIISGYFTQEYKSSVLKSAYLGKKGYTIPKDVLEPKDIEFMKADLYVKAETHGPKYGVPGSEQEVAFPVYKENSKKIYIPRFYGIERYGLPEKSEISEGESINVDFTKELRDYQCKIIDVYMKHVSGEGTNVGGGGILEVPCGAGKTVMALNIISKLKKKTLIIVHKEFLMNQWIERAQEFIPSAKIGKIQGPIFDVEGKDVVIGMLQTLYDRDFPENAFEGFGLTIVDEVHRIGSEQFSKTLLRVITKNMLGISATVDRKDGLTKILHMFIGPKIYSEGRKSDDPVCVRAIDYISSDPEFNTVEYDFRGNAKYSTMITKLCAFGPRSDFIVRVLGDLIKENSGKQIMVLCHNRSLLKYLFEAITHRAFATTGYYVGGMKQKDLQSTEEKQIVLATYAMAAEALDIKTLSTLVMVTPKTDIIQSVGRILRVKHENPIIVDIVDRHDIFQNQFRQRKTFYRKCNYRIVSMDSIRYQGFTEDSIKSWTKVFEPRVFETRCSNKAKPNESELEVEEPKCMIQIDNLDINDDL